MAERKEGFLKKIDEALKKSGGEDSNFHYALTFHLTTLRDSKTEDEIETREELSQYLLSKMFIDKMDLYPTQPFKCQIDENSDWPLTPLPSEFFGKEKTEESDKTLWFYTSLKVGDVLDCRVSDDLPAGFKLRVIHKHGVTRLLEDLQLMFYLRSAKNENEILKNRLLVCEFVRVAVCEIVELNSVVQEVYVTVDVKKVEEFTNFKRMPKLGRITQDEIPSYVFAAPDTEKFPSYADYLISKPQFHNPHFYNGLIEGCGIDPKIICSYFPEYNRQPCNESQTGQSILKESKLTDTKRLANSSLKYMERKNYDDGLKLLEDALKICPSDDSLMMGKLYDIRSDIYSAQMNSEYNFKSLCDTEVAFNLAPKDDGIKQKLLDKVFMVANNYYRAKNYKKAVVGLEFVVQNDENHRLAARILNHIKTKHSNQLLNLEEMSQIDLQEKKKELLTELKKIKIL